MPEISGIEVLKVIKKNPDLGGVLLVLHSALPEPVVAFIARDNGADGMLLNGSYDLHDVAARVDALGVPPSLDGA